MLDTRQRKPLVLASSVSDEGFISEIAPSPGLIPGTLATCPAECTPRPRNLPEYQAACHAAEGESVREYNACQVMPDMQAYHNGRFLTVATQERGDPDGHVELRLRGDGVEAVRIADTDAPIYCLA